MGQQVKCCNKDGDNRRTEDYKNMKAIQKQKKKEKKTG